MMNTVDVVSRILSVLPECTSTSLEVSVKVPVGFIEIDGDDFEVDAYFGEAVYFRAWEIRQSGWEEWDLPVEVEKRLNAVLADLHREWETEFIGPRPY